MSAIHASSLERLDDVGPVFIRAGFGCELLGLFLHPVWKVGLKPCPAFRTYTQIAARLAINPAGEVNPVHDFAWTLAIPREVFREVAIRFGAVVAEAFKDIDADFFRLRILGMPCEQLVHQGNKINALPRGLDAPCLVINTAEHEVDILPGDCLIFIEDVVCLRPVFNALGYLVLCTLNAVTEAHGANASIFFSRPCQHTHRV